MDATYTSLERRKDDNNDNQKNRRSKIDGMREIEERQSEEKSEELKKLQKEILKNARATFFGHELWNVWSIGKGGLLKILTSDFEELGLLREYSIPSTTMMRFLMAASSAYQNNPYVYFPFALNLHVLSLPLTTLARYHNFKHGFDCSHTVRVFHDAFGLTSKFSVLETLSTVVAAILHDVGHPGLNNSFHVQQQTALALRYNDTSVLENVSAYR